MILALLLAAAQPIPIYTVHNSDCDPVGTFPGWKCNTPAEALEIRRMNRRDANFCGTRWSRHILADEPDHRPLPDDPWVRRYVLEGASLNDAQITRADNVVNGCDK